jgi:hypothetical protein
LTQSWDKWKVVMLDGENKLNFYLPLPSDTPEFGIKGPRENQTEAMLSNSWTVLKEKPANTIFITRKIYAPILQSMLPDYKLLELPTHSSFWFLKVDKSEQPVAFIPIG